MMKKSRRVVMEPSPSPSPSYWVPVSIREGARVRFSPAPVQGGEEARARFKHQVLLQDYEELLKDTQAKKKKIQQTIQKKLQLIAEVKFLRRKYESFVKKPTQETPYRLKKRSHGVSSQSVQIAQSHNQIPVNRIEFASKDKKQTAKEAVISRPCVLLDLNKISFLSAEDMQEFPMESKRSTMEGGSLTNGFKRSVVRDVGSEVGKRKISWQDQVAPPGLDPSILLL